MKKKIKAPFRVRLLDEESGTTKREEVIDRHDICRLRMAMMQRCQSPLENACSVAGGRQWDIENVQCLQRRPIV